MKVNFFKEHLPYGMQGNHEIGWFLFNRERCPLGLTKIDYPAYAKYETIDDDFIHSLSELGCKVLINVNNKLGHEGVMDIYFYSDESIPINTFPDKSLNKIRWDRYSEILRLVSYAMNA